MRVLVTGAGGFIGSHVVGQLAARQHEVMALDRDLTSLRRIAPWIDTVATTTTDLGDVERVRSCLDSFQPDAIVHLAWYAAPHDYLVSPENLASLAVTTGLVQAALASGCRKLVLSGTCVEYALRDRLLTEADPADPRTLYAACKHAAWWVARTLAANTAGAQLSWARVFHLHGPGEDERRLIPWVARELRAGNRVDLTDGTQVRDHLHVADVAAAIITLLTPGASGIYNVCSGEPITLRQVLEVVGDIVGNRHLLRFGARPHGPNETLFLAGSSARLRSLGWAPRFDLREGLMDTLSRSGPVTAR